MTQQDSQRRFTVLASIALILALAGIFTIRVMARESVEAPINPAVAHVAPTATVPAPTSIALQEIPAPTCWGCSSSKNAPLEFQLDLDLLAPLGTGSGNAADWFKDFTRFSGSRHETEGRGVYSARFIENTVDGVLWRVLPGDDSLLLEAEPWIDQARCSFYPEVYEVNGMSTEVPFLLTFLDLARSWVWRGMQAEEPEAAREDFSRAIRLGRLLRQDDVTVIQDLVAVACIRLGAEAIYELAREGGDATTMLIASRVLADKDAIRLGALSRVSQVDAMQYVHKEEDGRARLLLTDVELGELITGVKSMPDRRFRMEGIIGLQIVLHMGSSAQQTRAHDLLTELAEDSDPLVAQFATLVLTGPFDPEILG